MFAVRAGSTIAVNRGISASLGNPLIFAMIEPAPQVRIPPLMGDPGTPTRVPLEELTAVSDLAHARTTVASDDV
jgi:hypothetical protein